MKKIAAVLMLLLLSLLILTTLPGIFGGGGSAPPPERPGSARAPDLADAKAGDAPRILAESAATAGAPADSPREPPPDDIAEVAITAADGSPVEGAAVLLLQGGLDARGETPEVVARATTDDTGTVRFPALPFRRYMLKIDHPDYAVTGDIECFGGNVAEVRLTAGGVLTGEVREKGSGRPLPGVTVYAMDWCMLGVLHEWWTETDDAGRYRIERLGPGRINVRVFAPGYVLVYPTTDFEIHAGRESRIDFDLQEGVRIPLRVVDEATGLPLPEVRIAYSRERPRVGSGETILTEPLPGEPPGMVEVSAPGYVTRYVQVDPVKLARPQDPVEVRLTPCIPVRGRVVDPDGATVADLSVAVVSTTAEGQARAFALVTSDASGEFRARCGIAGGELTWTIRLPDGTERHGEESVRIPADAREIALPPIVLETGCSVGGIVLDDAGDPLNRAIVAAYRRDGQVKLGESYVDQRGRFRLTGLPPQEVILRLGVMEGWAPSYRIHRIVDGEELVWRLDAGFEISGRLLDREGRPVHRVYVEALPSRGFSVTDEAGRFRIRGLTAGPHRIHIPYRPDLGDVGIDDVPGNTRDLEMRCPKRPR